MLTGLPIFKGCLEELKKGAYSFHVHVEISGEDGEVFSGSSEIYETKKLAKIAMKQYMRDVCKSMSYSLPKKMIDPSKFIDADEIDPDKYGAECLH